MAHWITDGSSGFTLNGSTVTYTSNEKGSNVFNCLWQDQENGVSSGKHYWKIHFKTLNGDGGVGLTSKEYFKKGWALQGLCYKGNLSDGGGLLVQNFGPSISSGDIVGILADFQDGRLKVYIEINGKSLGLTFDIPALTFKSIFPIVSFHDSGSATCEKMDTEIPNLTDRLQTTFTGIEGDWKLTTMENGSSTSTSFEYIALTPTANLKKNGENTYKWRIKTPGIYTTLFSASLVNEDQQWKTLNVRAITDRIGSDITTVSAFENLMKTVKLVEIESDGSLSIKSEMISSKWMRYDSSPGPYVTNAFP